MTCSVKDRGYPPGNITWQQTDSSSNIISSASNSAILSLVNISAMENSNSYTCSIKNEIGQLSIQFSLRVQGEHILKSICIIKNYIYSLDIQPAIV